MVIGITGKCCSGKSYIVDYLQKQINGIEINLDQIGHDILDENVDALVALFGPSIQNDKNTIDRRALGRIVFKDKSKLRDLENLVHPLVFIKVKNMLQQETQQHFILHAALLDRGDLYKLCDVLLFVKASFFRRLIRARMRDNLSWLSLLRRIWQQKKISLHLYRKYDDIRIIRSPLKAGDRTILAKLIPIKEECHL